MMRTLLSASLFCSTALLSTMASAVVDMKDKDLSPVSVHPWSGFYAGVNVGLIQHTLSITDNQAVTFNATIQQITNPSFSGGFQLGYRRQLNPSHIAPVLGLEFEMNFTDSSFNTLYGSPSALYQLNTHNKLSNVELVQLIGGVAVDQALFFLTAGLSISKVSGSMVNTDGAPFFESVNLDKTSAGGALGVGVEYALNEHFSARIKVDAIGANAYTAMDEMGNTYQIANHSILGTVGLNYQFG